MSRMMMLGTGKRPAGSAYQGPGDIQAFTNWWGMRAYNAASIGSNIFRLVRASDSAQQDFASQSDGYPSASAIATFLSATSGKVVTWYDQVGGNNLTQGTDGNRPTVTANAVNTYYGATVLAASSQVLASSNITSQAQPYSIVAIAKNTSAGSKSLLGINSGSYNGFVIELSGGVEGLRLYAGALLNDGATAALNTWYAIQSVVNGASSVIARNGSEFTGDGGAQPTTTAPFTLGAASGDPFTGSFLEAGYVAGSISGGNRTSLNTNMRAAYGGF